MKKQKKFRNIVIKELMAVRILKISFFEIKQIATFCVVLIIIYDINIIYNIYINKCTRFPTWMDVSRSFPQTGFIVAKIFLTPSFLKFIEHPIRNRQPLKMKAQMTISCKESTNNFLFAWLD